MRDPKGRHSAQSSDQRGVAFVEFAIVVPVLIIFFWGILEFGRIFSQLGWLVQASYLSTLYGGELVPVTSVPNVQERAKELFADQATYAYEPEVTVFYDQSTRSVEVKIQGTMGSVLDRLPFTVSSTFRGPALVSFENFIGNLSTFSNWYTHFDCDGNPVDIGTGPSDCVAP